MNIEHYTTELRNNTENILSALSRLTPIQQSAKPADGWSVLEILEHIYLTEKSIIRLLKSPPEGLHDGDEKIGRQQLKKLLIEKRQIKVEAPEFTLPKGILANVDAFETAFADQRARLIQSLEEGTLVVDSRLYLHPYLGKITVSDWLYLIIYHSERHLGQLQATVESAK
jgi:uncharacterized damage-inducible protein DinB